MKNISISPSQINNDHEKFTIEEKVVNAGVLFRIFSFVAGEIKVDKEQNKKNKLTQLRTTCLMFAHLVDHYINVQFDDYLKYRDDENAKNNLIISFSNPHNLGRFFSVYDDIDKFKEGLEVLSDIEKYVLSDTNKMSIFLSYLKKDEIEEYFKNSSYFKEQIKASYYVGHIFKELDDEKRGELFEIIKDKIIVNSINEYNYLFQVLNLEQIKEVIEILKTSLVQTLNAIPFNFRVNLYQSVDAAPHLELAQLFSNLDESKKNIILTSLNDELSNIAVFTRRFLNITSIFNEEQIKIICNSFKSKFKETFKNCSDFCSILNSVEPSKRLIIIESFKDNLLEIIDSSNDFNRIMSYLNEDQKNELIKAIMPNVLNFIKSSFDIRNIMQYANDNQQTEIYNLIQPILDDIFKPTNDIFKPTNDIRNIMEFANDYIRNEIFQKVINSFSGIDNSQFADENRYGEFINSFEDILINANDIQRNEAYQLVKNNFSRIKTLEQLSKVLNLLNEEQIKEVVKFIGDNIVVLFSSNNFNSFNANPYYSNGYYFNILTNFLKKLIESKRNVFLESIEKHLHSILDDEDKLKNYLTYLDEDQLKNACNILKPKLINLFTSKSVYTVRDFFNNTNEYFVQAIYESLMENFIDIVKSVQDLEKILRFANDKQKNDIIRSVKPKLVGIINSSDDLKQAIIHLDENQIEEVCGELKNKIKLILKNNIEIKQVLEELKPNQRNALFNFFKEELFEIIFSDKGTHTSGEYYSKYGEIKVKDFYYFWRILNKSQIAEMQEFLKNNLKDKISSIKDLKDYINFFDKDYIHGVCNILSDEIKSLIKSLDDLLFVGLPYHSQIPVIKAMGDNFNNIITNCSDLIRLFNHIANDHKEEILKILEPNLEQILTSSSNNSKSHFDNLFGNKDRQEKQAIYYPLKKHFNLILSSSYDLFNIAFNIGVDECKSLCLELTDETKKRIRSIEAIDYSYSESNPNYSLDYDQRRSIELPEKDKMEILKLIKPSSVDDIKDIDDLEFYLRLSNNQEKNNLLENIKPRINDLIKSCVDLGNILPFLNSEQTKKLSEMLSDETKKKLKNDKSFFNYSNPNYNYHRSSSLNLEASPEARFFKSKSFVKSYDEDFGHHINFENLSKKFNKEYTPDIGEFCSQLTNHTNYRLEEVKKEYEKEYDSKRYVYDYEIYTHNAGSFKCENDLKKEVFKLVEPTLLDNIDSVYDLELILRFSDVEQRKDILKKIKPKFQDVIKSTDDLGNILKHLNCTDINEIKEELKPIFNRLFKRISDITDVTKKFKDDDAKSEFIKLCEEHYGNRQMFIAKFSNNFEVYKKNYREVLGSNTTDDANCFKINKLSSNVRESLMPVVNGSYYIMSILSAPISYFLKKDETSLSTLKP